MAKLLVVEDDATLRTALVQTLTAAGYSVESAENGLAALEAAKAHAFDLIISDIRMPGMDGVAAVSRIEETLPRTKTILITGYSDDEPIIRALNLGIDAILKKPFALKDLLRMVSQKLEEKKREDAHVIREEKIQTLLTRMRENFGDEKIKEIFGPEFQAPLAIGSGDSARIDVLLELGRMAEMRGELEAAVQAYEEGLSRLNGSARGVGEFQIRRALSDLFFRKGELELSGLHAREALELAEVLGNSEFIVDAHHALAKILIRVDPQKSRAHLLEAKDHLETSPSGRACAVSSILFTALWFWLGEPEKARESAARFLSFGRSPHLSEVLIANQGVGLLPFLSALKDRVLYDRARWIFEECGALLFDQMREALKVDPSLSILVDPLLSGAHRGVRPALEIFGFGRLRMFIDGYPLLESHWRSMKGRSLFLYLTHEYPKPVSEDRLLDLFWPLLNGEKGRHAFRTTLYFIRRTLGMKLSGEFLMSEKQKHGIRPGSRFSCDFLRFRDAVKCAREAWEKGNRDRAVLALSGVDGLYKGDFLEGWSEEWAIRARDWFKEACTWMYMALASYHRRERSWHEALRFAKKAVDLEPTLEEAHHVSIESFLEIGRRDEAVRQFHSCRDILKTELNVTPSQPIRELYLRAVDTGRAVGVGS